MHGPQIGKEEEKWKRKKHHGNDKSIPNKTEKGK
jgi:hypothetical protein